MEPNQACVGLAAQRSNIIAQGFSPGSDTMTRPRPERAAECVRLVPYVSFVEVNPMTF
jgi:hypothetical protein